MVLNNGFYNLVTVYFKIDVQEDICTFVLSRGFYINEIENLGKYEKKTGGNGKNNWKYDVYSVLLYRHGYAYITIVLCRC